MKMVGPIACLALLLLARVGAECPNACSSHGKCGAFDMCTCYRNWMANDCSQRICQFGKAHADSPKGDLDASSGALSGPGVTVVKNDAVYPCGAEESFPNMADSAGNVLTNTAHSYMECSNKGVCDRNTGTCGCFDGYSGAGCQYASCPTNANGICSGHGTCQSAKEIALNDNSNMYDLWDESATLGCSCDPGYTGPDCSLRTCKYGADPLYYDDVVNVRYQNTTFVIYTQDPAAAVHVQGTYALIYTDNDGKQWQTVPISYKAECADWTDTSVTPNIQYAGIISALEGLPNNIVPAGSVRCLKWDSLYTSGNLYAEPFDPQVITGNIFNVAKFTVTLPSNPGNLPPLKTNFYLDGTRATLYTTTEVTSTLGSYVFSNGFYGEDVDYVPDLCSGVTVTLAKQGNNKYYTLTPTDASMLKLLKTCLGGADGVASNNIGVENWDYGSTANPHLIKLGETTDTVPSYIDTKQCHYVPFISPMNNVCRGQVFTDSTYATATTQTTASTATQPCNNFNPPGFYAVLQYDSVAGEFQVFTRAGQDYGMLVDQLGNQIATKFSVFTTTGYLQRVSTYVDAYTNYGGPSGSGTPAFSPINFVSNVVHTIKNNNNGGVLPTGFSAYDGNVDCDANVLGSYGALDCLSKGDIVMVFNTDLTAQGFRANPVYPQMYTVEKVTKASAAADGDADWALNQVVLDMPVNAMYTSFRSLAAFSKDAVHDSSAGLFKFHPPANGGERYVTQCAGRGICNQATGVCECFNGYTSVNCGVMDALAI